jgi:hypothetical protein
MAWVPLAAAAISSTQKSGGAAAIAAPITSRSGDTGITFGSFGGVTIGNQSNNTTLYIVLAAVALAVVLLMVRR